MILFRVSFYCARHCSFCGPGYWLVLLTTLALVYCHFKHTLIGGRSSSFSFCGPGYWFVLLTNFSACLLSLQAHSDWWKDLRVHLLIQMLSLSRRTLHFFCKVSQIPIVWTATRRSQDRLGVCCDYLVVTMTHSQRSLSAQGFAVSEIFYWLSFFEGVMISCFDP